MALAARRHFQTIPAGSTCSRLAARRSKVGAEAILVLGKGSDVHTHSSTLELDLLNVIRYNTVSGTATNSQHLASLG